MEILKQINGENGYAHAVDFLTAEELRFLRLQIEFQYCDRLRDAGPRLYHAHSVLWPKSKRILNDAAARLLKRMQFMVKLASEFGPLDVTSEEGLVSDGEFYWRLVRPNVDTDVGPLHADRWFWEAAKQTIPTGKARVKVWMPIWSEPGANGLFVVPGSHRDGRYTYDVVERDGRAKPVLTPGQEIEPVLVPAKPGDAIVFHDSLIHGGAVNRGKHTRVSIEFTMLVDKAKLV